MTKYRVLGSTSSAAVRKGVVKGKGVWTELSPLRVSITVDGLVIVNKAVVYRNV